MKYTNENGDLDFSANKADFIDQTKQFMRDHFNSGSNSGSNSGLRKLFENQKVLKSELQELRSKVQENFQAVEDRLNLVTIQPVENQPVENQPVENQPVEEEQDFSL